MQKRQKKLWLSGTIYRVFRLPCVKGAVGASRLRDCFFTTLQPLRGFRTRLGDACKCASHTRKSLPPLRGPPPLTQGRHIQTHLGDSCKSASHTRKSLYTREPFLIKSQLCRTASLRFSLLSFISKNPPDRRVFLFHSSSSEVLIFSRSSKSVFCSSSVSTEMSFSSNSSSSRHTSR